MVNDNRRRLASVASFPPILLFIICIVTGKHKHVFTLNSRRKKLSADILSADKVPHKNRGFSTTC